MDTVVTRTVEVQGESFLVRSKGRGPKLGFLAGFGGLPKWTPFLDELAQHREVIVPSLPGFPGGGHAHKRLDTHLDWVLAVKDVLAAAGLAGVDLAASSVGAGLAAEVAAIWPETARRLVLIAPFGLFHPAIGMADPWAQRTDMLPGLLCENPERFTELWEPPADVEDPIEWRLSQTRAIEASARIYFPLGDTRVSKRLGRIVAPTLLVWGERDALLPPRTVDLFASMIRTGKEIRIVRGAGHLAELDQPRETANAILAWVRSGG